MSCAFGRSWTKAGRRGAPKHDRPPIGRHVAIQCHVRERIRAYRSFERLFLRGSRAATVAQVIPTPAARAQCQT
jgi:hypothetical protein